ncbi:LINE-type retrotransposon LIb DNA [Senna tora]|uniref:LINE-type retrotransposon LIb DNA n=1 Tax=Senna tora TaxID=362788 RepID=A0A834TZP7_9FABA|nr:LINE-type retrotransposon LIb DNA [Senna tora]
MVQGPGLLGDHLGNWIRGFSIFIVHGNAMLAKLWAIYHGLSLATQCQIKNIIVEVDSLIVVNLLKDLYFNADHHFSPLIRSISSIDMTEYKSNMCIERRTSVLIFLLGKLLLLDVELYAVALFVPILFYLMSPKKSSSTNKSSMASTQVMLLTTMAVVLTVLSVVNFSHAADAPAPSPTSPAAVISPSIASACLAAAVALIFGSALRI